MICVLTSRTWSSVTFAAVAMLASPSPATTVWLDTMLQFVPIAAVVFEAAALGGGVAVGSAEAVESSDFAARVEAAAASRRHGRQRMVERLE